MRRLVVSLAIVFTLLGAATVPALADPDLPNIPAHRHFIQLTDGTLVEVGPRLCDNPNLQEAFNQFHFNVHRPEGAPGLHNHSGPEITARPCSFVP